MAGERRSHAGEGFHEREEGPARAVAGGARRSDAGEVEMLG